MENRSDAFIRVTLTENDAFDLSSRHSPLQVPQQDGIPVGIIHELGRFYQQQDLPARRFAERAIAAKIVVHDCVNSLENRPRHAVRISPVNTGCLHHLIQAPRAI